MKRSLLFLLLFTTAFTQAWAFNGGLRFYTENGEKFTLFTNGTQQGTMGVSDISAMNFPTDAVRVRIVFQDSTRRPIENTYYLTEGFIENHKIARQGSQYRAVFMSQDNIAAGTSAGTSAASTVQAGGILIIINNNNSNTNIGNSGGSNTCSTCGKSHSGHGSTCSPCDHKHQGKGNHQNYGPMSAADFQEVLNAVQRRSFDSDKLTVAKQAARGGRLSASQVTQLMKVLSFESSRLELAKYAYSYVWDPSLYFKVNDGFSFSSSVDELDRYIAGL